ncbi:MAG: hypothetical protein EOO75_00175 [Myxococcales bacterium]|nr:MAG: hypothetical protein EOO75_00175 [Myxococcales bacterium]
MPRPARSPLAALVLLAGALSAGCKDDHFDQGDIVVRGRVSGLEAGRTARAAIIWTISPDGPDYAYGQGDADADGFEVRLLNVPPESALNAGKVGVGLITLVADGGTVPVGSLAEETTAALVGVSARTALIYRQGDPPAGMPWASNFPGGLSCGRCVPPREGETVETYEPIACPSVEVLAATAFTADDVCRWH